jgi:hypothetical protein
VCCVSHNPTNAMYNHIHWSGGVIPLHTGPK